VNYNTLNSFGEEDPTLGGSGYANKELLDPGGQADAAYRGPLHAGFILKYQHMINGIRENARKESEMQIIQVGMNTLDMPGSLRLYSEVFGFANAGSQAIWGPVMRIQGLGERDRATIWWLVGRQPLFQLELFTHTSPVPRPMRTDWRPNDHGWVRIGIAVRNFDAALSAVSANGVVLLGEVVTRGSLRRAAFRDPFVGTILEILEDGDSLPWSADRPPVNDLPAVVYATSSVPDLEIARDFYSKVIESPIEPLEVLHQPADEASWGLAGAQRRGFITNSGGVRMEVVEYTNPRGRHKSSDYRLSDQGLCNVAICSKSLPEIEKLLERVLAAGVKPPYVTKAAGSLGWYINEPGREIEMGYIPPIVEATCGYTATTPFFPLMG
jgi:catechol 2,3-dioxygenase-like lactoylglutathione lyase family enzyme